MRKTVWKQMLSLAAAVCMVVCMMPAVAKADEPKANGTYLALGDSISTGYRVSENQRFTNLVATDMGFNLVNKAVDGETSESLLNTTLIDSEVIKAVEEADVVTITVGGNDLMNVLYQALADAYNASSYAVGGTITKDDVKTILSSSNDPRKSVLMGLATKVISDPGFVASMTTAVTSVGTNLSKIIVAIKSANPSIVIVVSTQYNPYSRVTGMETISDAFDLVLENLNKAIRTGAGYLGCEVADVYTEFLNAAENPCNASISDLDFHPNGYGHLVIASILEKNMKVSALVQESMKKVGDDLEASFADLTLDQSQAGSKEVVSEYLENVISAYLTKGMTSVISISDQDFSPAVAGTADQKAGTDGKFKASVQLNVNGILQNVEVAGVIKATAYTAPAQDPSQEDDDKDAGKQTAVDNGTNNTDKKPVNTTVSKTDVPKTGDTNSVMPYLLLMLAAGTAVIISVRRKRAEK